MIRSGIDRAFPPFGSISADNNYIGFSTGFMRIVGHRLNISFDIDKDASWDTTMQMAQAGKLDVISTLVNTKERLQFSTYTPPFVNNPTIIINDDIKNGDIGSVKNLNGQ